ncbi:kelch repeat-containing protein [Lentzea sp. BCCO 10_0856]|uniref:Kelch repeat-containing protein n=1 Tax=Lentzea miocenica TaxID=3095431 RepID=A0ABU4T0C3_9PSEU|nr:kelch repeat-containing protein [Lentzea sp. BCCO 10_0856]MDX8031606.1 kelch repeat-containing protein [Lentzea sp. BCCO 10_0856]
MAEWRKRPSLVQRRKAHDGAIVNEHIIVVTGVPDDEKPPVPAVEARRRAGRGEWRSLPPMITARGNPAVAAVDGKVYVAGGGNQGFRDEVERFDPREETWTSVSSLPQLRAAPAGAGLNGLLYVAGGSVSEDDNTDSVVVFDPEEPEAGWKEVAPMLDRRARHKLIAVDGHLYAIGGENDDFDTRSSAERYDPHTDTWTRIAPMRETRAFFGIAVVRHDIAVVGGYTQVGDKSTFLDTIEIYDVREDRWRTIETRLPQRRVSLFAATEPNGSLLAIGGVTFDDDGIATITDEVLALSLH